MFLTHMSVALELIALGIGAAFVIWSSQHKGNGHRFAKIIGIIIMILAIIDLSCTLYSSTFRKKPMMNMPMGNMMMKNRMHAGQDNMASGDMMNNGMCQCPMTNHDAKPTVNH